MKFWCRSRLVLIVALFALTSVFTYGCKKDTPKPEEIATSEAVLAEEAAAEEAKKAEEARSAAEIRRAEEARMLEEARMAEDTRRAEEARMFEEARMAEEARKAAALMNSHKVKKGECLWVIAEDKAVYDNPFKWPLIYKTNRAQIKDPDLIYPDQVFEIPRESSQRDIDEAVHEAKTRGPWSLWDGK